MEEIWVLRKDVQLFLAQVMAQESKMFKVNSWNTVSMRVYRDFGEQCSICKNPLNEACITCIDNGIHDILFYKKIDN